MFSNSKVTILGGQPSFNEIHGAFHQHQHDVNISNVNSNNFMGNQFNNTHTDNSRTFNATPRSVAKIAARQVSEQLQSNKFPQGVTPPSTDTLLNEAHSSIPSLSPSSALPSPSNPLLSQSAPLEPSEYHPEKSSYAASSNSSSMLGRWNVPSGASQAPIMSFSHSNGYNTLRNTVQTGNAISHQQATFRPSDILSMDPEAAYHFQKLLAVTQRQVQVAEAQEMQQLQQQDRVLEEEEEEMGSDDDSDEDSSRIQHVTDDPALRAQSPLTSRMAGLSLRDTSTSPTSANFRHIHPTGPSGFNPPQQFGAFALSHPSISFDPASLQSWMPQVESHIANAVSQGHIPPQQHLGIGMSSSSLPPSTQAFVSSLAMASTRGPPSSSTIPTINVVHGDYTEIRPANIQVTNHGLSGIVGNNTLTTTNNTIQQQLTSGNEKGENVSGSVKKQGRTRKPLKRTI